MSKYNIGEAVYHIVTKYRGEAPIVAYRSSDYDRKVIGYDIVGPALVASIFIDRYNNVKYGLGNDRFPTINESDVFSTKEEALKDERLI